MPAQKMRFASGITDQEDPAAASRAVLNEIRKQLDARPAHLALLFVSTLYRTDWRPILRQIRQELGNPLLLGCMAGGVLGGNQEMEATPALSLAAAFLPRVDLHPFTVSQEDLEETGGPGFWIEKTGVAPGQNPIGILLPEPFSCDCMKLVAALNATYPTLPLIGGLASGAESAGETTLFFNDGIVIEGAVGVFLTGDVTLQTIVSQGCRPIGRPYIVTKADGNVLLELAGRPATEALQELFRALSAKDQALARRALLIGVVMNEYKEQFRRGDFLIRNLIGIDPSLGAIAVGDQIPSGKTVQFQVRDAHSSREDLATLLKEQSERFTQSPSAGALLFSCLGRGRQLYGQPHYDIRTIQAAIGNRPLAGFFCNGEIGPIGGMNYIHGFTSSLGLFRPKGIAASASPPARLFDKRRGRAGPPRNTRPTDG